MNKQLQRIPHSLVMGGIQEDERESSPCGRIRIQWRQFQEYDLQTLSQVLIYGFGGAWTSVIFQAPHVILTGRQC